ncbi:MAG: RluA family pseudouridine synthase [Bdellovibrio sp.]
MKSANQKSKTKSFFIDINKNEIDFDLKIFKFLTEERHVLINKNEVARLKRKIQNDRLIIEIPVSILKRKSGPIPNHELTDQDICYEDDDLIIVNKPSGIPSQSTLDPNRDHLFAMVERKLKKPCFLHHRLDVETSGLVLFCKTKSMNKVVGAMFENKTIQKDYVALVSPPPLEIQFTVENYLGKIKQKILKMTSVNCGGDKAITDFKVLAKNEMMALVKASPRTGRTHQIRVHLSERGSPIIADTLYGTPSQEFDRLMLHAFKLSFDHPRTGERVNVEASIPKEFLSSFETPLNFS